MLSFARRWYGVTAGRPDPFLSQGRVSEIFLKLLKKDEPGPEVLVIAAHPDDEVIGAGTLLARNARPSIVHVTDGSPRNMRSALAAGFLSRAEYARARRKEFHAALQTGGIKASRCLELGVPDQEAGFSLVDTARRILKIFKDSAAKVVLTHPYEGGHPDHDSTAFAVHAACELLRREKGNPPLIAEFTSYHSKGGLLSCFEFLPCEGTQVFTLNLSGAERAIKERMYRCYETQKNVLKMFPISLERFRPAPVYDFKAPPHKGKLFYEYYDLGLKWGPWRKESIKALKALGMEGFT